MWVVRQWLCDILVPTLLMWVVRQWLCDILVPAILLSMNLLHGQF